METDVYIKVLEYGYMAGLNGTTKEAFYGWAETEGIYKKTSHPEDDLKARSLHNLFQKCFDPSGPGNDAEPVAVYVLRPEYYSQVIEYRSARENRLAVKKAAGIAWWALVVATAAILVSVVFVFTGMDLKYRSSDAEVRIHPDQINHIIEKLKGAGDLEVSLNRLQLMQILSALESQPHPRPKREKTIMPGNEVEHHELINRYFEEKE